MSQATSTPVSVMENAGEGGAWGIALLASYVDKDIALPDFLEHEVFASGRTITVEASRDEIEGFEVFIDTKEGYQ